MAAGLPHSHCAGRMAGLQGAKDPPRTGFRAGAAPGRSGFIGTKGLAATVAKCGFTMKRWIFGRPGNGASACQIQGGTPTCPPSNPPPASRPGSRGPYPGDKASHPPTNRLRNHRSHRPRGPIRWGLQCLRPAPRRLPNRRRGRCPIRARYRIRSRSRTRFLARTPCPIRTRPRFLFPPCDGGGPAACCVDRYRHLAP